MRDIQAPTPSTRLSEEQVRERLVLCENAEVLDEIYEFGIGLSKEINDQIKSIESKAISIAAYGAAIASLLVTSSSTWIKLGTQQVLSAAVCAALCGGICTAFAVRVLKLQSFDTISEDEWLKAECFANIERLKKYRVLTLWGVIDSHIDAQARKAKLLLRAEVWLTGSVAFLVLFLGLLATRVIVLNNPFWISLGKALTKYLLGIPRGYLVASVLGLLRTWFSALLCGIGLVVLIRRTRRL
jgi:hypothetical protein